MKRPLKNLQNDSEPTDFSPREFFWLLLTITLGAAVFIACLLLLLFRHHR